MARSKMSRRGGAPALEWIRGFCADEDGADLIEYSLLMAFICLTGAAMYIAMGQTTNNIWGIINNRMAAANQNASGS